jgi:hypothetical protein
LPARREAKQLSGMTSLSNLPLMGAVVAVGIAVVLVAGRARRGPGRGVGKRGGRSGGGGGD